MNILCASDRVIIPVLADRRAWMDWILDFDAGILLFIQEYIRQDFLTPLVKFITHLGDAGWFWIALSVVLLFFKKTRRAGITALLALLIGALITNVALKNLVARIRPYEVIEDLHLLIEKQSDYSFPSGHTCASFAAGLVYLKMLPRRYGVAAILLAVLIAFSRLYVGVHYPTDILGGILVGSFAAWAAYRLSEGIGKKYYNAK